MSFDNKIFSVPRYEYIILNKVVLKKNENLRNYFYNTPRIKMNFFPHVEKIMSLKKKWGRKGLNLSLCYQYQPSETLYIFYMTFQPLFLTIFMFVKSLKIIKLIFKRSLNRCRVPWLVRITLPFTALVSASIPRWDTKKKVMVSVFLGPLSLVRRVVIVYPE